MAAPPGQGIHSLSTLLKSMNPILDPKTYVFAHIPLQEAAQQGSAPAKWLVSDALAQSEMLYREREGWTIILPKSIAEDLKLDFNFPCKKVTLDVHSALDAVGFLAAVTTRLAEKVRVGVNPVSGYFHDHLFVPLGREEEVVAEIRAMAAEQV